MSDEEKRVVRGERERESRGCRETENRFILLLRAYSAREAEDKY